MNPDVDAAIGDLQRRGILSAGIARHLGRIARGELVSLNADLHVLLYAGVLLVAAGVSLLLKANLARLGPVTIAVAIGVAAVGCLAWVASVSPPFTRGEAPATHLAFEYLLLLAALLVGAELAYVEYRFTALGAAWPWHLLLMSLVYAALAIRYDSRIVFSLALSTFAAWRGVSVAFLERDWWSWGAQPAILVNALACGLVFLALGFLLTRTGFKAHFEPIAIHFGCIAILYGLASGAFEGEHELLQALLLLAAAAALVAYAWRARRFLLFALGVMGAFVAVLRFFSELDWEVFAVAVFLEAIATIGSLLFAHRRLREPA